MRKILFQISDLVILLSSVVLLFTAGRAYFYFNFQHHFNSLTHSELINAFFSGFEYDLKVVLMVNSIFIILFFIPTKIYNSRFFLSILKFIYFTFNTIALFFNILDVNSFGHSGKRMNIVNFKTELLRMSNDLLDFKFEQFIKDYLILLVCLIIFIIILRSLLDFIQKRDFEIKSIKQTYTVITVTLFLSFGWFSYNIIVDNGTWLTKLYQKANRKLAPLVMNNPYMFISSATSGLPDENEYWDQVQFQSENSYDSIIVSPIKHICLVFIDNSDSSLSVSNEQITKKFYQFNVLSSGFHSTERYLNEALLSFPSLFPFEFYQSVYSLNSFESLPQILEKKSFVSNLYSIGYSNKQIKLLRNFHGFKNARLLDSVAGNNEKLISAVIGDFDIDSAKKTFDVIILKSTVNSTAESLLNAYLTKIKNNGLAFVLNILTNARPNAGLVKSMELYLPNDQVVYCPFYEIAQCLDIKPSILHYLNYQTPVLAYGSSIFSCKEKTIFTSSGSNNYYLLKDSLLLNYSNNETKSLLLLKNRKFLKEDFKDSLAVEKIDMENQIHSIFQDFEYRMENDKLK